MSKILGISIISIFLFTAFTPIHTPTADNNPEPLSTPSDNGITLIEKGWSDNAPQLCSPNEGCLTILPGFYYWIYENSNFPCGAKGNHQFMVLGHSDDTTSPKNLFVKFPGGAVGFWYLNTDGKPVYYPNANASALLTQNYFYNLFFRSVLSLEHANGITKRFRDNDNYRILFTSYCSHDLYQGRGEYNEIDGFSRWGYLAAMSAVDYVQQEFTTGRLITYGGSAGASGSFYIGKDQDNVAGIIMDSQAVDLSAISDACYDGINVFGNTYPCFCPEGGLTCMEILAPRIGFDFHADEPYKIIQSSFDTPIYYVWNQYDASRNAHLQFDNLQQAIEQINPGGKSIANMVCINDPTTPPGPICNLHVPSGYDYPGTIALVNDIYTWALSRTGELDHQVFLPLINR